METTPIEPFTNGLTKNTSSSNNSRFAFFDWLPQKKHFWPIEKNANKPQQIHPPAPHKRHGGAEHSEAHEARTAWYDVEGRVLKPRMARPYSGKAACRDTPKHI